MQVASALANGSGRHTISLGKNGARVPFLTWINAYPQKQEFANSAFDKVVGSGSHLLPVTFHLIRMDIDQKHPYMMGCLLACMITV